LYSILSRGATTTSLPALVKIICGLFLTNAFVVLIKGKILFLNSLMFDNFNLTKLCSICFIIIVFPMLNVGKQKFSPNCNNALTFHGIIALLRFLNHLSFTSKMSYEMCLNWEAERFTLIVLLFMLLLFGSWNRNFLWELLLTTSGNLLSAIFSTT